MRGIIVACLGLFFAIPAQSTTRNAASCNSADFITQISASSSGDTVLGPGGSGTWSADVVIPNTKGITVDGGGCSISGAGQAEIDPNSTTGSRFTNFTFTASSQTIFYAAPGSGLTAARWRFDHNTITGHGSGLFTFRESPGLFDHNTITAAQAADEFMHPAGWGSVDTTGWTTAMPSTGSLASGTDEAVFVEDNTFTAAPSESNNAWIESSYGARVVYRYNTFNYTRVDSHGTGGNIGTRWWEFYNNNFVQNSVTAPGGYYISLRAGSGVVFSNTYSGNQGSSASIGLCEEDSGYPADYQIGRGTSQTSAPAYGWSNQQTVFVDQCEASAVGGMVAFNRDVYTAENSASCTAASTCTAGVGIGTTLPTSCTTGVGFWKTDAGGNWDTTHGGANDGALYKCTSTNTWTLYYTPYTYPHSLQGGGSDTTVPTAGASGAITFAGVTSSAITVNWTKGTDDTSAQGALQYEVCRSASSISSVGTCESNIVMTFTTDIATYADSGLSSSTTYHYNVVVKDEAGNKTLYVDNSQATSAPSAAANSRRLRR